MPEEQKLYTVRITHTPLWIVVMLFIINVWG